MATNGHGIAHRAKKKEAATTESDPLYDSRNPNHGRSGGLSDPACASVTPTETLGYQICKRCAARLEKMRAVSAKRAAKQQEVM